MKYMLIDVTTTEETKILLVAELRQVQEHGKIAIANGRKVLAPPVEGRGFAKLDKMQLQYLYWNTCGKAPPEDYAQLIRDCLLVIRVMMPDRTPLPQLMDQVKQLYPDGELAPPVGVKEAAKAAARAAMPGGGLRPKATSTTGLVWDLADQALAELGGYKAEGMDWKPIRARVVEMAEFEGINMGTVGVQFGKWKASQIGEKK